jgi:CubicO group peptidase (beta-lactamase class C family)
VIWLGLTVAAMAAWTATVFVVTANGFWRTPLAPRGDAAAFAAAIVDRLETENPGNAAFKLLENGAVVAEHYLPGPGGPVGQDSLFQMASASKWVAAWSVMTLVEAGAVDLNAPVETYLTRWHLPESPFDNDGVTVRRLLSHTAGLTDGLGYGGFPPGTQVQPLEESLSLAVDAMPWADGRTRVGIEPGSEYLYSGGGFGLLQLIVEEVTQTDFNTYVTAAVLQPLGLDHTTYSQGSEPMENLVTFYDSNGMPAPHYQYIALAAAGLYSTAADMTRFVQAHLPGPDGAPPGRGVLLPETLELMREPHASDGGRPYYGFGQALFASNGSGDFVIGHDGGNRPAINTTVRLNPATGNGIVLLLTGNPDLATRLGREWVFWNTGALDVNDYLAAMSDTTPEIVTGCAVIAVISLAVGWLVHRRRTQVT